MPCGSGYFLACVGQSTNPVEPSGSISNTEGEITKQNNVVKTTVQSVRHSVAGGNSELVPRKEK